MAAGACLRRRVQVSLWWAFGDTVAKVVSQSTLEAVCALEHRASVARLATRVAAITRIVWDEVVLAIYTVAGTEPFGDQVSGRWTSQALVSRVVFASDTRGIACFAPHSRGVTKVSVRTGLVARCIDQHEESRCTGQTLVDCRPAASQTACSAGGTIRGVELVTVRRADGVTRFINLQEVRRRTGRTVFGTGIVALETSGIAHDAVRHGEVEVVVRVAASHTSLVVQEIGFGCDTSRAVADVWSVAGRTVGETRHALVYQLVHEEGWGRTCLVAELICRVQGVAAGARNAVVRGWSVALFAEGVASVASVSSLEVSRIACQALVFCES